MKQLASTAPGKLVLCGEYAVLDGAPAIVSAVDRRAIVQLRAAESWSVCCPGFRDGSLSFDLDEANGKTVLRWPGGASPVPLLDSVFREISPPLANTLDSALAITLDTTAFRSQGRKLGLGSSAALTVALTAALAAWTMPAKSAIDEVVGAKSHAAHRHLQDGAGSGLDVATSLGGHLLRYLTDGTAPRRMGWPEGLHAAVFWSGIVAKTTAKLARLASSEPHASRPALGGSAAAAAAAWERGTAAAVLEATSAWVDALAAFSDAYSLDVFAAGHDRLVALARNEGLVYKPCGAGGGDIGVLLGADPERIERFASRAEAAGFQRLPLRLSDTATGIEGLSVEWMQD
ncbi:MAG: hypothetical protein AAGE85_07310 [Pseudomonadota bacterium]